MPAIVKLQLSLQDFAEAIASLDLEEKRQLQEMIEQQIFGSPRIPVEPSIFGVMMEEGAQGVYDGQQHSHPA